MPEWARDFISNLCRLQQIRNGNSELCVKSNQKYLHEDE